MTQNDARKQIEMIYLDFGKAFYSVPHKQLLFKLWKMSNTGDLWLWFKNYLTENDHIMLNLKKQFQTQVRFFLEFLKGVS